MKKATFILFLLQFLLSGNIPQEDRIRMVFNTTFRPDKIEKISKVLINFNDTIPNDSLTIYYSGINKPVAFSRDIHTAVCMDSLCRLVDITLFWEITGKYLGFKLPPGTELTKKKHLPFTEMDYNRLNEILSDSASQLGFYTPAEIHPAQPVKVKTDGISGATIPDLGPWIVPEAAYTSYTLWHLAYGSTPDSIVSYTKKHFISNSLLFKLLESKDAFSQLKGLQWTDQSNESCSQFIEPALKILHNGKFNSSGLALKFLKKCNLDEEKMQKEVIQLLDNEDFRIKNSAIEYFRSSAKLYQSVAKEMIKKTGSENYYLVNVILSLIEKKYQPDFEDQVQLSALLNSHSGSVANRVYIFLLNLPSKSPGLAKQLNRFKNSN
jgi:hypothetical protein